MSLKKVNHFQDASTGREVGWFFLGGGVEERGVSSGILHLFVAEIIVKLISEKMRRRSRRKSVSLIPPLEKKEFFSSMLLPPTNFL